MLLDTRTLYSVVVGAAVIGGSLLWLLGRRSEQQDIARSWALALAALALYFGLVLTASHSPRWLSVGFSNGWAVALMGGMARSASMICHRRFRWTAQLIAAVTVTGIVTTLLLEPRHYEWRVALVGVITSVQCAMVAATLLRRDDASSEGETQGRRVLAVAFGLVAVMQAIRVLAHSPLMGSSEPAILAATPLSVSVGTGFLSWTVAIPVSVFYIHESRARAALRTSLDQLRDALSEVKTLRSMLPMCAGCRSIRDENDQWSSVEAYLTRHAGVRISHGLCPDCVKRLYPEFAEPLEG